MKKLIIIIAFTFSIGARSESIEDYKIEPINCIAALSWCRDYAEYHGEKNLMRQCTNVQNNIYLKLPGFPEYSLIENKKRLMSEFNAEKQAEIMFACINKYE